MKPAFARLMMLATALAIGLGFWPARARLEGIVRPRLAQSYQRQLAKLSDRQAALFIQRLARSDNPLVEVLVTASADDHPVVAAAAATQLRELVDRWAALAPEEYSSHVAKLARLLAQQAPALPTDRRLLAHSLAERLIEWPIDGQLVDAAGFIDDCQAVLLLARAEPAEIRVAALSQSPVSGEESNREPLARQAPAEAVMAETAPPVVTPAPVQTPQPPQSASTPQPNRSEPGTFKPAGAVRITDD